jgi:DNA-directed RNA polymerase specialized sigma24 family protein
MDRTDADLIERAKKDPDAFRELYERHAHSVFRQLRGATNDERVALELTAETFAQAACSLGLFRDLSEGSAGPWLHGIARNLLAATTPRGESRGSPAAAWACPSRAGMEDSSEWRSGSEASISLRRSATR